MTAWLLLSWAAIPLAIGTIGVVRSRTDGPALNAALAKTGACTGLLPAVRGRILAGGGIGS